MKNILIYTPYEFSINCGGIVVQYELCKIISNMGINIQISSPNKIKNSIFNNYTLDNEFDLENTIVIYGETIEGNPLNAKYIVRWILAPLGMCCQKDISNTWGKNDLVYYFNYEPRFDNEPEKIGTIYKLLSPLYLNPYIKQTNFGERNGVCYTIRKGKRIHGNKLSIKCPPGSFEIKSFHSIDYCIEIFNKYEWFLSYDSLTFLIVIAALCGCIPVIYKVDGMNKQQWIETTVACNYLKSKGLDNLYGIAYGREDMEYAKSTLHLVKEQWDDIINYCKEKTVLPFIEDIQNFENMQNTIKNNYII
jgi:hypothetical protein